MRDVFVEDFESEPFMTAFQAYFSEISGGTRNWPMLFRQMNTERDVTKAIMGLDGDTVIGFVMFCEVRLSCAFFAEAYGYIRELWVHPAYRRTGIGGHLLSLAESYFTEHGLAQIMLNAEPQAVGFYRKKGYEESTAAVSESGGIFTKKCRP